MIVHCKVRGVRGKVIVGECGKHGKHGKVGKHGKYGKLASCTKRYC